MKHARWKKTLVTLTPLAVIGGILYGCSSNRPDVAGSGAAPNVDGLVPCDTPGATRDCHQPTTVQNGVRTCMHGTQICTGGYWSPCGSYGQSTLEGQNLGLGIPGFVEPTEQVLRPQTHASGGEADAAACTLNPCTPECRGYDEDAGLATDASLKFDAAVGVAATPPGFVNKLLRDNTNSSWSADCDTWETGDPETGHIHSACQSDYYCQRHAGSTIGNCVQFGEGPDETHAGKLGGTTNGGVECSDTYPDLTLGTPCRLAGNVVTPICNRGAAPVPAGTVVTVAVENAALLTPWAPTNTGVASAAAPMAGCPTHTVDCNITMPDDLNPGSCVRFTSATCAGLFGGNGSLYVNADRSIRECIVQPRVLGPPASVGAPAVEQDLQYGCANNYTGFNTTQIPACTTVHEPKTVTFTQNGVCLAGSVAEWSKLAWSASTPSTTSILFEIRVRSKLADGTFGAWTPWVTVGNAKQSSAPPDDPEDCPMNGPAPCPKDLFTPLSDAGGSVFAARGEELELRLSLNPVGPDGPILYSYNLAYSCVARE